MDDLLNTKKGEIDFFTAEYRMDPVKLKATYKAFSDKSDCAQIIKKIIEIEIDYFKKCHALKTEMEKSIVRVLKSPKAKKILY